jgi:hypothetical protein
MEIGRVRELKRQVEFWHVIAHNLTLAVDNVGRFETNGKIATELGGERIHWRKSAWTDNKCCRKPSD